MHRLALLVLLTPLIALVAAACSYGHPARTPGDAAVTPDVPGDAGPPVMPGVGGPAGVYLTVGDDYRATHVVVIDERGARRIPGSDGLHPTPRAGGGAWLAGKDTLYAWDGAALTPMPRPSTDAACCRYFVGPADHLWAFDGQTRLARWDGAAWQSWAPATFGAGDRWVAVAAGGARVHAITAQHLLTFDDDVWTRRSLPALTHLERVEHVSATHVGLVVITTGVRRELRVHVDGGRPIAAPDGRVFALEDDVLVPLDVPAQHYGAPVATADGSLLHLIKTGSVRIQGTRAESLAPRLGWDRAVAITGDGTIWATRGEVAGVLAIRPDGTRLEPAPMSALEAFVRTVTADDRGRVWVSLTPGGLAVIEDGVTTMLPTGSLDGVDGTVQAIAIPWPSPALPAWPAPRRVALHGRVVDARGRPAVGADVEVCWAQFAQPTFVEPCRGDDRPSLNRRVTTDRDGNFRLDDVPAGALALFGRAKGRGRWYPLATRATATGPVAVDLPARSAWSRPALSPAPAR